MQKVRGFTLIELMIVVAIIGILAAVAIPSFVRYTRRSKTMEAVMAIRRMYDGAVAYYVGEHADKSGAMLSQKFPDSAPPAPAAGIPCANPVITPQSEWGHPSWQALDFAVSDPQRFQYEFADNGQGGAAAFATMYARGDLNCNHSYSEFSRSMTGMVDGVMGGTGLVIINETESRFDLTPAFIFVATLAAYLIGLAPDLYWLDSSELAAGAFTLGVAHPPGHPLALVVGKLFCLLPFGTVAAKVGLASALAGAGAAAQTAWLGRWLATRAAPSSTSSSSLARASSWLGAAAGLSFGLSYAAAFSAVRPEVYALSAFLVLSAAVELAHFDSTGDRRRVYLAALWIGLGLANHHLLTLAIAVPAVIFVAVHKSRGPMPAAIARVSIAGALGLSAYAYLPLRAMHHPMIDWGAPTTFARVFWVVSAQAFQKAVARGQAESADALGVIPALATQLHLAGALLALAGLYLLIRMVRTRRIGLFLLGAIILDAAAPALVGFDEANPDAYGYLEAAVALAAAAAVVLPAMLAARMGRANVVIGPILVAGALAWGAWQWPRIALDDFHDTGTVVGAWLDRAPPSVPVVTSYFQTVFAAWYLSAVEGRRPDIFVIHRHFLSYPGYRDDLVAREPELAPLLGTHDVNIDALDPRSMVEYDFELPDGLLARSQVVPVDDARVDLREPQTRRFAAWMALLDAHRACRMHLDATAQLQRALSLVGNAPELSGGCATLLPSLSL